MSKEQLLEHLKTDLVCNDLDLDKLVADIGKPQLIQLLLDNTGNTHSLIRENIMGLHGNLVGDEHFNKEELNLLFHASLDNMFKGLGRKDDDTVFCRAFAALFVEMHVGTDMEEDVLSPEEYTLALDKAIEYMNREVDRRGNVPGKGWADAIGHASDLFCCLAAHPSFPLERAQDMLNAIQAQVTSPDRFTAGEEQRLANVIPVLLEKGLSETALQDWIKGMLPKYLGTRYTDEAYHKCYHIIIGITYFLIALHYTLSEPKHEGLRKFIAEYQPKMWQLSRIAE